MIGFILYCIIGVVVTAVCQRVVYKGVPLDGSRPYPQMDTPPRMALSVPTGVLWPVAVGVALPVWACYKLVNKGLDKILKV